MNMNAFIQLIMAFIGSLGFAMMFGLRAGHLIPASLGGMFSWGIYLAVENNSGSEFLGCLAASVFSMVYSEFLARTRKSPATLFIVPAIIPLVPGSSLYYAMSYAVNGDAENAKIFGHQTLIWVLSIAAGISFVTAIRELRIRRFRPRKDRMKKGASITDTPPFRKD